MQKNVTSGRRKGCPNYLPEFKQQLVAASCEPGVSISKLALENGINANNARCEPSALVRKTTSSSGAITVASVVHYCTV